MIAVVRNVSLLASIAIWSLIWSHGAAEHPGVLETKLVVDSISAGVVSTAGDVSSTGMVETMDAGVVVQVQTQSEKRGLKRRN